MIYYTDDLTAVREDMLDGFFVGWPRRPSAAQHLAVLRGSYRSIVAIDDAEDRAAGFVNMISDGALTAFIPWLEVLPAYQRQGIGSALMRRILDGTDRFYSVDLVCDAELVPYYERFGMRGLTSAMLRHPATLEDPSPGSLAWNVRLELAGAAACRRQPVQGGGESCLTKLRSVPSGSTCPRKRSTTFASASSRRAGLPGSSSPIGRRACSWRRSRSSPATGRPNTTGARARRA